jgi:hypothetical protein
LPPLRREKVWIFPRSGSAQLYCISQLYKGYANVHGPIQLYDFMEIPAANRRLMWQRGRMAVHASISWCREIVPCKK